MKNEVIYALLKKRGLNIGRLAALAGVSRSHLSEAFLGKPGRGGVNKKRVAKHMTREERAAVGWEKLNHVEQGST